MDFAIVEVRIFLNNKEVRNIAESVPLTEKETNRIGAMTAKEIFDAIKTKPVPCRWSNE